jgi:lipopolysaccharide transport system ATP-binding protein
MKAIIRVDNLSKEYSIGSFQGGYRTLRDSVGEVVRRFGKSARLRTEKIWALRDVSFEVHPGEVVGVIGRNGAGKSTLLKILSRITEPTSGTVDLFGRVASLLEVGTGFHPELTGRENIFLNGAMLGMRKSEIVRKFDEIVAFAEIERFLDTPVKHYSSGMYVRLAFAVAAHLEPEILIVDEVLAVGDAEFQKKCLGKMREVSEQKGRTVLFVSHNLGTIAQLCGKCILLRDGAVAAIGPSSQVVARYYDTIPGKVYRGESSGQDVFFQEVFTCRSDGVPTSSFAHSEEMCLRMRIGVNRYEPIQNIGIALLSSHNIRVFTVNRLINSFHRDGASEIVLDFVIEAALIAPGAYSFLVVLNSNRGLVTYEYLEGICPIKVYDDGTDFALFEGRHYGYVIVKDKWRLISN